MSQRVAASRELGIYLSSCMCILLIATGVAACKVMCVAVCCSASQCVAVRCSALQCVAVRCRALQYVAVRCSVSQCIAMCEVEIDTHCSYTVCRVQMRAKSCLRSALQYVAVSSGVMQCVAAYCSVLQRAAACCSVLQCAEVCCSVLQCVTQRYIQIGVTPPAASGREQSHVFAARYHGLVV